VDIESDLYTAAIAAMEATRGQHAIPSTGSHGAVLEDAAQATQVFSSVIEPELKKAQFALQTAHYRSRVDVPLRGPSLHSRVATLYAARLEKVSTVLQFLYTPESPGLIAVAIFRFSKGLREKPSNWTEDILIPIADMNVAKIEALVITFINALAEQ
jgi:hypothetical protein